MPRVTGADLLTGAAALLADWRSVPAAALLNMFVELSEEEQGGSKEEAASHRRDALALLAYIDGGDFERAHQRHKQQQEALQRAVLLVAEDAAEKRRKARQRQQRKAWLRDEVAELSREGATRREMAARLQCSGWEIGHAVGWCQRNGIDIAKRG